MTKIEMTEAIMAAKSTKGLTWGEISEAVGLSEIFLSSACLGQNSLLSEDATKLTEFLELDEDCLLYTSPSPRDVEESRMPSSA